MRYPPQVRDRQNKEPHKNWHGKPTLIELRRLWARVAPKFHMPPARDLRRPPGPMEPEAGPHEASGSRTGAGLAASRERTPRGPTEDVSYSASGATCSRPARRTHSASCATCHPFAFPRRAGYSVRTARTGRASPRCSVRTTRLGKRSATCIVLEWRSEFVDVARAATGEGGCMSEAMVADARSCRVLQIVATGKVA